MKNKDWIVNSAAEHKPIHLEGLHHVPHSNWAYLYDKDTFHLRVRTQKENVKQVFALTGDKYDWKNYHHEHRMQKIVTDQLFDYWETAVKPKNKRFSYAFRFHAGEETVWMTEEGIFTRQPEPPEGYFERPYIHEVDLFKAPEWAKSAVFYQIMPDRFANGDPGNDPVSISAWGDAPTVESFFGGDLQGIIDHLDHLAELGITAIYLTPIFEAPSNHKYNTTDYRKVDPNLGDLAVLKNLVQSAHARQIRVVLDAVFNHISAQSSQFQDVIEHGLHSPYAGWFHIHEFPVKVTDGKPNYEAFGFFAEMPKLNTANPEARKYLLDTAAYWMNEVAIDGWRLDVANEVDHTFWRNFRRLVKTINPDAFIIGEVWSDSMRWLHGDQFDSVMNYPLARRLIEYLNNGDIDAQRFGAQISNLLMRYPQQANEVLFNLLASHDTPRILTQLGGDARKLKLAAAFLFTFTGTPCILYGDEIGLEGTGDPDCRKCMIWEKEFQNRELFECYRSLIRLRVTFPALQTGCFHVLKADPGERAFVYERMDEHAHFVISLNPSEQLVSLSLPLEGAFQDVTNKEQVISTGGSLQLHLEPFSYQILIKR
ncbi:glycoside hydrolase family 13 protein [Paenibacillus sp. P32E]|uniref:glycoside hydrolase family 13 protein n=1 Tax=Paenibacillus sp. P32E TaxID=1349434 RepID=UPI000A68D280|nr:glycoside hydrolase family 13 protein [Paenibacillus sp. P32E]